METEMENQLEKNEKGTSDGSEGENAFVTATWRGGNAESSTPGASIERVRGTIDHFTETHDLQDNSTAQSKLFDWQYVARMHGVFFFWGVFTYLVQKAQASADSLSLSFFLVRVDRKIVGKFEIKISIADIANEKSN